MDLFQVSGFKFQVKAFDLLCASASLREARFRSFKMITLLMIFFGIAILQAGIRMMVGHDLSAVPMAACIVGFALIFKAVARLLLWLAPKSA